MRIIVIFLVFLALIAAGGTAFLAKRFLDTQKQAQNEQKSTSTTERTLVIVAATKLAAGTVLRSGSLKWQSWPNEGVSDTYLSAEKKDTKIEKNLVGMVLRSGVLAGTPLTKKMVLNGVI